MSDNPFQSPQNQSVPNQPPQGGPAGFGRSYVKQVPVIASLMIAQGVLLMIFALIMIGYAFVFSRMDTFLPPNAKADLKNMMKLQETVLPIVFGVMSAYAGLLGMMHMVAAYFGFHYRHRVFGITTMICGLGALLTVYCAPTAIGLAIYGMIIYFNPAVIKAFQLRKAGRSNQEVLAEFPY